MRDNGNGRESFGLGSGSGVVRPSDWTRTEWQVRSHDGFAPEALQTRGDSDVQATEAPPTMLLASPPKWTHRDDLPCIKLVPKGNARDPYDTSDKAKAKALCAGCPVQQACLDEAMEQEKGLSGRSRYLVRGGLTPHERGRSGLSNSPNGLSSPASSTER